MGGWVSGPLAPHPWHCSSAPLPWPHCLQPELQPLHMPTVFVLSVQPWQRGRPQAGEVPVTSHDFPQPAPTVPTLCVSTGLTATAERVQQLCRCPTAGLGSTAASRGTEGVP